ncbi:flagellar basal body rod protein FlgC [Marinimicrococcus flavescens]|uniref:Flagellar basal-body rod protein FlgC n=1 Tax=Marinimicrococcus flavescens TaxID=3031815 RepID=A0AAP3V056_9PROT|nr:flagellar basal body rod protein FlgC [Marinimicrococcus flavescens]
MDLDSALRHAGAGMKTQSARLRVVAQNLANAQSTGDGPGAEPYRRRTITFGERLDRESGLRLVDVRRYGHDRSEPQRRFEPAHPAADAQGWVAYPNVEPLVELMDMREAQRSFEANLGTMQTARALLQRALDLLR